MPQMDGFETAEHIIRNISSDYQERIIIITAYDNDLIRKQAEELGLKHFLTKPISVSTLFNALVNLRDFQKIPLKTQVLNQAKVDPLANISYAKILLAEDNQMNQQIVKDLLQHYNLAIDIAEDGEQAIAKIKQTDYQLVFMDIQMPKMDGYQATRIIREDLQKTQLPIVAMTAHAMKNEVDKCLNSGMNDHLSKPIDPAKLFATLLKWIPAIALPAEPNANQPIIDYAVLAGLSSVIAVEKGLFYVNYNQALYYQLLENFYREQSLLLKNLQMPTPDFATLRDKVHALKGLAGSLGMETLFNQAALLEQALTESQQNLSSILTEFSQQLAKVLDTLAQWIAEHGQLFNTSATMIEFNQAQALTLVEKLLISLEDDLALAKSLVLELKPMLQQHPDYKADFLALEHSLTNFDTETTMEIANKLMTQFHKA
jgi:CheY-like chemotaxis protein